MEPLSISGPAGALEAMLRTPLVAGGELAILCHPHPLYGGSMHDAVLDLVGRTLGELSVNCLKFNFRGVGASEGDFDGGRGETEDLLAVVDWAREQDVHPRGSAAIRSVPMSFAGLCRKFRTHAGYCW